MLSAKEVSELTVIGLPLPSTTVKVISVLVSPTVKLAGPVSAMVLGTRDSAQKPVITRFPIPEFPTATNFS